MSAVKLPVNDVETVEDSSNFERVTVLQSQRQGDKEEDHEEGVTAVPNTRRPNWQFLAQFHRFRCKDFAYLFATKSGHESDDINLVPFGRRWGGDEHRVRKHDEKCKISYRPQPKLGDGRRVKLAQLFLRAKLSHWRLLVIESAVWISHLLTMSYVICLRSWQFVIGNISPVELRQIWSL